jgi:2'-5' RNA ligase
VLWAGLGGDTDAVTELHRVIDTAARPLGIEREKRGFTPHITLGRIRSDFGALALVDELRKLGDQLKQKPFTPTELVLYRSVLKPSGAEHRSLVRRVVPRPVGAE